jgi:hypothetical protein
VDYLSSAGVELLIDTVAHASRHHVALQFQLASRSLPARVLALTGLEDTVPLVIDATEPPVS